MDYGRYPSFEYIHEIVKEKTVILLNILRVVAWIRSNWGGRYRLEISIFRDIPRVVAWIRSKQRW